MKPWNPKIDHVKFNNIRKTENGDIFKKMSKINIFLEKFQMP